MHIKKFHGRNMRESIEMMRREIGSEAVILSSEQVMMEGRPVTELVAGIHPEDLARFRNTQRTESIAVPTDILYAAGGAPEGQKRRRVIMDEDSTLATAPRISTTKRPATTDQDLQRRLDEIQSALKDLATTQRFRFTTALPDAYKSMYEELREAGYTEEQAMFYIGNMSARGLSGSAEEVRATCLALIEKSVRTSSPIQLGNERSIVLVIGAPGSGKTTFSTLLSQSLHLTLETRSSIYRQAASTAEPLVVDGARYEYYTSVNELMESLTTNTNEDISFIELSLSPGDDESWERCETIMDVVRPDCVLVTVQAGSHAQRMKSWLDFAEAIEGCSMVLTGIDIDGIPGEHVYGMAERNIPLAFLTHGATSPLHVSAASGANVTAAVFRTR